MITKTKLGFIDVRKYIYDSMIAYVNLIEEMWTADRIKANGFAVYDDVKKPVICYHEVTSNTNSKWIRKSIYQIDIRGANIEKTDKIKDLVIDLFNRKNISGIKSILTNVWPDLPEFKNQLIHKPLTFSFVVKDQKF